jgi:hypothetical protein
MDIYHTVCRVGRLERICNFSFQTHRRLRYTVIQIILNEKVQIPGMKLHSLFRRLSIVCYSFILMQGMIIAFPFILVLTFGIGSAEPGTRPFMILADLGLVLLAILSFQKKTKGRIALECLVYLMLLSPLLRMLAIFPLSLFDYPGFIVPFGGFVILYPLSVLSSWLEYSRKL